MCSSCRRSFSIDYRKKEEPLWIPHIDGVPFRKLGDEHGLSGSQAYNRVFAELQSLPDNTELTRQYCEYSSGILIMDGKYIKVRGYNQKIPFIYGIDYDTHDILFGILVASEDTAAFLEFFRILKSLNYPLRVVVADDRNTLPLALKQLYPDIPLQLCQNHYIENIRQLLHIRTDRTHSHFFNSLKKHVFDEYVNEEQLNAALHHVLTNRCENIPLRQALVIQIDQRRKRTICLQTNSKLP